MPGQGRVDQEAAVGGQPVLPDRGKKRDRRRPGAWPFYLYLARHGLSMTERQRQHNHSEALCGWVPSAALRRRNSAGRSRGNDTTGEESTTMHAHDAADLLAAKEFISAVVSARMAPLSVGPRSGAHSGE